jgi:Fe-S-cluster containining protein
LSPSPFETDEALPASAVHCSRCDAVCCRLTVVILDGDRIPSHLTEYTDEGLEVMARDDDGWCVAVDRATHGCTIYATRPQLCRKFAMGGPACVDVRADYASARTIPHRLT